MPTARALTYLIVAVSITTFALVARGEEPVARGAFSAAFSSFFGGDSLAGSWQVVSRDGALHIELGADFKAQSAPDLKLFLSPKTAGDVTGKNAVDGALRLGLLKETEGKQSYALPAGTDLSAYQSVVVHCEQYSKLWGTSPLR